MQWHALRGARRVKARALATFTGLQTSPKKSKIRKGEERREDKPKPSEAGKRSCKVGSGQKQASVAMAAGLSRAKPRALGRESEDPGTSRLTPRSPRDVSGMTRSPGAY